MWVPLYAAEKPLCVQSEYDAGQCLICGNVPTGAGHAAKTEGLRLFGPSGLG
jgi:hypothetical protein